MRLDQDLHSLLELVSNVTDAYTAVLFLPLESDPGSRFGAGLSNLEYAHLAEMMGRYIFASEVDHVIISSLLFPLHLFRLLSLKSLYPLCMYRCSTAVLLTLGTWRFW